MTPLVIVGAGGHGRELHDVVDAVNVVSPRFVVLGYLDDAPRGLSAVERRGARLLGGCAQLADVSTAYDIVIGIGGGASRRRVDAGAAAAGRTSPVLVHPSATLGSDTRLGPGSVLLAGARCTTGIRGGRHVHVNLNATVAHDCVLGDYVTVNPGANVNGGVLLEDEVTVGSGAVIRQGVRIGAGTVVGAGAVVVHDLPPGITAIGVPARPLLRRP